MTDDINTQGDPTEGQQTEQADSQVVSTPELVQGQPVEDRFASLEKQYKDLQREYTRIRQDQTHPQPQPARDAYVDSTTFFEDPAGATRNIVKEAFSEFTATQEQGRRAQEYLESFAEDSGLSVAELRRLNQQWEDASNDPRARLEMLATIHGAQNASEQITRARKTITETAKNNARAVTSEGGTPSQPESGEMDMEEFKSWPAEKRSAYLAKKHGVQEFGY